MQRQVVMLILKSLSAVPTTLMLARLVTGTLITKHLETVFLYNPDQVL